MLSETSFNFAGSNPGPNNIGIATDETFASGGRKIDVNVGEYDDPFGTGHTRDFYKGTSFRFAGRWKKGVHYIHDEYVVDFVVKGSALLVCTQSHMSDSENEPKDFIKEDQEIVGIDSPYWDFVLAGGVRGKAYRPRYDMDSDSLIWTLLDSEQLPDEYTTYLGLQNTVDYLVSPLVDDMADLNRDMAELNRDVIDMEIMSNHINSRMSDLDQSYYDLENTVNRFVLEVQNFDGDITALQISAKEFNVRVSNVEGDTARLNIQADEIQTRVENSEGDISELHQRADQVWTQVQNAQGDISELHQTADEIWSQVENAQEDISRVSQRADEISTHVENIDGDVSEISQRADRIETKVENNEGDISRVSQKADQIESIVENAQGDISILSQKADEIGSELSNTQGDVSRINQRADDITTRVENNEGDISLVEQRATAIESSVQNAQGDISQIVQRADLIEQTVRSNKEDVDGSLLELDSKIRQTSEEITSEVNATKIELDNKIETANSRITQQADLIESKVSQTAYDVKIGQIEQDTSRIEQRADSISQSVSRVSGEVSSVDQTLAQYITSNDTTIRMILDQLDGAIDTWFYEGVPTLNNLPASDWTPDLKDLHIGDIYYDKQGGGTYRFLKDNGVYTWVEIQDDALAQALALAQDAYDIATDHKRRIFIVEPVPPYDEGDLWIQGHIASGDNAGNGMIMRCINTRTTGVFNASDWDVAFDMVTVKIAKSSFDIFADAIQGMVWQQDPNGIITSDTYSAVKQTVDTINLHIENTKSALRATGIDIYGVQFDAGGNPINGGTVVITADNFKIQANDSSVQDALSIVLVDGHPKISASSLQINGIFSTAPGSEWLAIKTDLNTTAQGYATTSLNNSKSYTDGQITDTKSYADNKASTTYSNAQSYFNDIVYGSGGSAQAPTSDSILGYLNSLGDDVEDLFTEIGSIDVQSLGLSYITDALLNGTTIASGGLILTSLIQLGTTNPWDVWAGMSGQYVLQEDTDPTSQTAVGKGHGIAAWYGGTMADRFYNKHNTSLSRTAVSLFRMDGSGYLAKRNIEWEADGSGNVAQGNISWDAEGQLTVKGGILTTELKAGYNIYDRWVVMSGISGDYDNVISNPSESIPLGHGIASWFGGDKVDLESLSDYWDASQIAQWEAMTSEQKAASTLVAKSLFRFDGSGYLASGQIAWGPSGSLRLASNVVFGDGSTTTDYILQNVIRLASYFTDEEITLDGVTRHILRINTDGQNQNDPGFIGIALDGLILASGDLVIGDTNDLRGLPREEVRHVLLSQQEWEDLERPDPSVIYMIYES